MSFLKDLFNSFGSKEIRHSDPKALELFNEGIALAQSGNRQDAISRMTLSLGCELHPLTYLALAETFALEHDFARVEKNASLGLKNCTGKNSDRALVDKLRKLSQLANNKLEEKRAEVQAILASRNIRAIFKLFEIEDALDAVQGMSKKSIRFSIDERPSKTSRSRWGGEPDLPPDLPWPKSEKGTSLSFLMQLDCSELQKFSAWTDRTSFGGMLSLFVEEWYLNTSYQEDYKLLAFPAGEKLTRRQLPQGLATQNSAIAERRINFKEELSFPDHQSLGSEGIEVDFTKYETFLESFQGERPVNRIFGNPIWVQGEAKPEPRYELLFQLDSGDGPLWGDDGKVFLFIDTEKMKDGDFTDTVVEFQD